MRILVPAAFAAATAALLPVMPASAAQCSCRTVHRASYTSVRHHVRRVAYVRPVVRHIVYRPRIVEVVRPVVYRPLYRPVRHVYVEPMWRPRPVFYHARFAPRPWHHRWEGRGFGYEGGYRHGGYGGRSSRDGYGGGFRHAGWR
jgi:hypothetical protein